MREPFVFSTHESPFSPEVPPDELRRRIAEAGAEVITDEVGAVVVFLSEDDVEGVLNDPRFVAVALPTLHLSGVTDGPLWDLWTHLMIAKDADDHRRIRGVVMREFSPKRDRTIRHHSARDRRPAGRSHHAGAAIRSLADVREAVRRRVAATLVGIPEDDADQAAVWAFDLARAFFPFMSPAQVARAERSAVEIQRYMDDLLAQRRAEPQDDLVSILVTDEVERSLSDDEIRALACNMVFAGLEATAKGVTTGTYQLLAHGPTRPPRRRARTDGVGGARNAALHTARAERGPACRRRHGVSGRATPRRSGGERQHRRRLPRSAALRRTRMSSTSHGWPASSSTSAPAPTTASVPALPSSVLASPSRHWPAAAPIWHWPDGGLIEWDYEGFAGVVHLDCIA